MHKVETGIDTFTFYYSLTPNQKTKIMDQLSRLPGFLKRQASYFENTYRYTSDCFAKQGVKLEIFRKEGSIWGMYIILHPTLVLGDQDRSALYQPCKKNYKELINRVDKLMEQICVPRKLKEMKLYRVDVTANLIFDESDLPDIYLRILKKGMLLPRYHLKWFRKYENNVRDYKKANKCSYKQACKSAAFFAYDKTAQLEMIEKFPNTLIGKRVLRMEVQLRRKGMKKWVSEKDMGSCFKTLKKLSSKTTDIVSWYLQRMQISSGRYVRYEEAAAAIDSKIKREETRDRMLYLLRKTSDSRDLTAVLEKIKDEYGLKNSQIRRILKKFDKLGISPITLPNSETRTMLEPIGEMLKR